MMDEFESNEQVRESFISDLKALIQISAHDGHCENCDGDILSHEAAYVCGDLGHYCSQECLESAESNNFDDGNYEAQQMGLTG